MAYFTLATRTNGLWAPQFGDYDRETVVQERKDTYSEFKNADVKILKTLTCAQKSINEVIAQLNGGTLHRIMGKDGRMTITFVPNK